MSPFSQSSECVLVDVEVKPCTYGSPSSSDCSSVILKMTNTQDHIRPNLYKCSVDSCNSKFRRRADLVRHKASIHGPKASCPYNGCGYATGRKDKMKEHVVKIHKRPDQDTQDSPHPNDGHYENRSYPTILPKIDASNQTFPALPSLSSTLSPSSDTSSMKMPSSYCGSSIFDTPDFDNASTASSSLSSFESFSTDASEPLLYDQLEFYGIGNWAENSLFNDWPIIESVDELDASTKSSIDSAKFEIDFCRYEDAFSHFFSAEILALA